MAVNQTDSAQAAAGENADQYAGRRNLASLVEDMRRWGASPAVVEHRGVRRYETSYAELARMCGRFAAELERCGIGPGERVVLWGANTAGWIAAYFGCVLRGVLPVPLDAAGSVEFAGRVVAEVRPRWVVGDRVLLEQLAGGPGGIATANWERMPLDRLFGRGSEAFFSGGCALPEREAGPVAGPNGGLGPDSPLQIVFTSGTTGEPKGVVHTHRNLLASLGPIEREIAKYRRYERWFHPLRFAHTLPLSHVFGQFMGLWVAPVLGATVHYESRVTGARVAELIRRERVNVLAAVPRTLDMLRGHLLAERPELTRELEQAQGEPIARRYWRFRGVHRALGLPFWAAVCGGATLPEELERFWTTLGFALVQGYGLTETAALVTVNHPFRTARGSLGQALPGRALRVGASGELEVQGEMVSTMSWEQGGLVERGSAAAGGVGDGGGWFRTGDLAAIEGDGRVRFLGRTGQRLVTAAGLNVYLEDVERALEAEPELDGTVVLAMEGASGGEEPAAVVVARGGRGAAEAGVARANAGLAAHQQVRRWWLWPELALPRGATGKVQRLRVEHWARELAAASGGSGADAAATPVDADPVVGLLDQVAGRRGPAHGPGQESTADGVRLEEGWGLDSMGRVALTAALEERLGAPVSDGQMAELATVGDLRALVRSAVPVAGIVAGRSAEEVSAEPASGLAARLGRGVRRPAAVQGARVQYRYPAWPWSLPVRVVRFLFVEGLVRPLVRLLAAPVVRMAESEKQVLRCAQDDAGIAQDDAFSGFGEGEPGNGPMLLVSNHRTAMDVALLLYALPGAVRRRMVVAMSGEMLAGWERSWSRRELPAERAVHRRWWGPMAAVLVKALFNVFPLPRSAGFRAGFAYAGRALDRGYSVLIFPEGRRSPDGELLAFRPGLGILALEAEVPVLPMALGIAWRPGQIWLRSRPVVSIGRPVVVAAGMEPEQVTEGLQGAVRGLLEGR